MKGRRSEPEGAGEADLTSEPEGAGEADLTSEPVMGHKNASGPQSSNKRSNLIIEKLQQKLVQKLIQFCL